MEGVDTSQLQDLEAMLANVQMEIQKEIESADNVYMETTVFRSPLNSPNIPISSTFIRNVYKNDPSPSSLIQGSCTLPRRANLKPALDLSNNDLRTNMNSLSSGSRMSLPNSSERRQSSVEDIPESWKKYWAW